MKPKKLTLSDLNEAMERLEGPIWCKHCRTAIEWDWSAWSFYHKLPSIDQDHTAESWQRVMSREDYAAAMKSILNSDE